MNFLARVSWLDRSALNHRRKLSDNGSFTGDAGSPLPHWCDRRSDTASRAVFHGFLGLQSAYSCDVSRCETGLITNLHVTGKQSYTFTKRTFGMRSIWLVFSTPTLTCRLYHSQHYRRFFQTSSLVFRS